MAVPGEWRTCDKHDDETIPYVNRVPDEATRVPNGRTFALPATARPLEWGELQL